MVHDPDTLTFEISYLPESELRQTIAARLEGAELRRLARWLYAGTVSTE
jgi:hypothetical protein